MAEKYTSHHIKIMKVSLAIAIIRQMPDGVSTRKHVQGLAARFRESQVSWKSKACQLERELLRVRQELVSTQLRTEAYEDGGNDSEQFLSSGYSSLQPLSDQPQQAVVVSDSGVSLLANDGSDRATIAQFSVSERLESHLKFLKSTSLLRLCQESLSTLASCDFLSTLSDSMVAAMTDIQEELALGNLSALTVNGYCCQSVAASCVNALNSDQLGAHRAEVLSAASKLLMVVLNRLDNAVHSQEGGGVLEDLKKMVYGLSEVEELYVLVVEHMVSMVTNDVDHLQKCIEDPSQLSAGVIMSLGVSVSILDHLITGRGRSHSVPSVAVSSLLALVETTLLDVSHCFPLISHSIWRLHILLLSHHHI